MKHLLYSTSFSFYLSLISNRRGRCGHISLSRCKPKEREREKSLGISFRTRGCCSILLDDLVKKLELAFSEFQETLTFKMKPSAKPFLCENSFYLQENRNHFYINSFALSLKLKQRLRVTWKCPFLALPSFSRSQAGTHARTYGLILAPVPLIYFGNVVSLQQNRSGTRNKNGRQQSNSVILFSEGYDFSATFVMQYASITDRNLGQWQSVSDVSSV